MERAHRFNPLLNAFSYLAPPPDARGAAAGPPTLAVKDNIDVAGMPTGCGSRALAPEVPTRNATAVQRLVDAGMVAIGKTSMPELAFGGWGTNATCGTPRNPWLQDRHYVPGGSSSGSAVAVAAGLADVALGTDTGGSLRIPAALCGVVGLKPSFGRVSRNGVKLLSPSLDVVGPIARNVSEAAKVFRLISGPDPEDPDTQSAFPDLDTDEGRQGLERTEIGVLPDDLLVGTDAEVRQAYRAAVALLQERGARPVTTAPPRPWSELVGALGTILGYEAARLHRGMLDEANRMDPHVVRRLRAGLEVTPQAYGEALKQRARDQDLFGGWLGGFDAIVTPTTPITAIPVELVDEDLLPLSLFTRAINYLDWCAISLPCGRDGLGLPIGLQIIAGRGREADLLRIAAAFEAARGAFPVPDMGEGPD